MNNEIYTVSSSFTFAPTMGLKGGSPINGNQTDTNVNDSELLNERPTDTGNTEFDNSDKAVGGAAATNGSSSATTVSQNWAIRNMLDTNKENAGGLFVDNLNAQCASRPAVAEPPKQLDKLVHFTGETPPTEHGTNFNSETSGPEPKFIKKIDILHHLKSFKNFKQLDQISKCEEYVLRRLRQDLSKDEKAAISLKLKTFVIAVRQFLRNSSNSFDKVLKGHASFFESNLDVPEDYFNSPHNMTPPSKTKPQSIYTLKRKAEDFSGFIPEAAPEIIALVAAKRAKTYQNFELAYKLVSAVKGDLPRDRAESAVPQKMSPESALSMVLYLNLSKAQYVNVRKRLMTLGSDVMPSYDVLLKAKQLTRPPSESLELTDTLVSLPLQQVLDNTAERLIEYLKFDESIKLESGDTHSLVCSYGFDGSSGQANYKQKFDTAGSDDSSLFASTLIPLALLDGNGKAIWRNPKPQSARYCRPIRLQFKKESQILTRAECDRLSLEISRLATYLSKSEPKISVRYDLHLTLLDGKVLSVLLNKPSPLTCPICGISSSRLNDLSFCKAAVVPQDNLRYGISPLHTYIRFLEFVLKLSYRLDVMKWRCSTKAEKESVESRKRIVQEQMWEKLGLRVDYPKQNGAGSSNDGNTARRAFKDPAKLARILEIDEVLVRNFATILIALNCREELDASKFEEFCSNVAERYVSIYDWCYMSPTVHKVLTHGPLLSKTSILPLGYFGEEASESRNKDYKNYRLHHARKCSRQANLEDVFWRAFDSSDICRSLKEEESISNKKVPLPKEVMELLAARSSGELENEENCGEDMDEEEDILAVIESNLVLEEEETLDENVLDSVREKDYVKSTLAVSF